ncbi:hypothetical protein M758_10G147500 [Ceratodon purpureus]|nr:hypothetical protein M758_10G147500 [Ceratodon purpureus]
MECCEIEDGSSVEIMVSKTSMLKHFLQRQVIVRGQDCLAGLNFVILTFTDSETLPLVWGVAINGFSGAKLDQ